MNDHIQEPPLWFYVASIGFGAAVIAVFVLCFYALTGGMP